MPPLPHLFIRDRAVGWHIRSGRGKSRGPHRRPHSRAGADHVRGLHGDRPVRPGGRLLHSARIARIRGRLRHLGRPWARVRTVARARARPRDGVREVYVGEEGGTLVEVLRPPSSPDLRWRIPESVPLGGRWETSPAAEGWVASLAAALVSGYVVLIDYGGSETELLTREGAGTIRGFAQHRLIADPLSEPGRHDLTASVDFTAIRRAAEGAGLRFAGSATQREMLVALGIREATARPSTPIEQLRAASRRSAVDALLDPNGLGAFKVVCFAKGAPTEGLRMFGAARAESAARYP